MNIEINILTLLKKDLKNVSERNCPFNNLDSLPKDTAEIETGMAVKSSLGLGPGKQTVWFGEIERKLATVLPLNYFMGQSHEMIFFKCTKN